MKHLMRKTVLAAGFALAALGMTTANAATVTTTSASVTNADAGFSWTVNFICSAALPCNGGNPGVTLTASAVFTLTSVITSASTVQWGINLVLSNTGTDGFLTAMGFNTDPNAVLGSLVDSALDGIVFSGGAGAIPGFNTELCVWDGNSCTAANDHDLTTGLSDTMSFVLTTGLSSVLDFTNFAVKVAGAGQSDGSFEFGGTIGTTPAPVPLPAAGGLLLVGLGALVALRRKQKAA